MLYRSLNDAAYSIIRGKLLEGQFRLGERIREDVIADEISMSRTPVREAINRLVAEGVIVKRPQKGLYLIDPTVEEIQNAIDIRCSLEKLAVERCIQRATAKDLERITDAVRTFEVALSHKTYDRCFELDAEFHALIALLANNRRLVMLLDGLTDFFTLIRQRETAASPREGYRRVLVEHRAIAKAIADRDTAAANKAMADHLCAIQKRLVLEPV